MRLGRAETGGAGKGDRGGAHPRGGGRGKPRGGMGGGGVAPDDVIERRALLVARRDVEEAELVGALAVVEPRLLDGIAGIDEIDEIDALDDAAVLDVETGDKALLQHAAISSPRSTASAS